MVFFMSISTLVLLLLLNLITSIVLNSIGVTYDRTVFFSKVISFCKRTIQYNSIYISVTLLLIYINNWLSIFIGVVFLVIYSYILDNAIWIYLNVKEPLREAYRRGGIRAFLKYIGNMLAKYGHLKFNNLSTFVTVTLADIKVAFYISEPEVKLKESLRQLYAEKSNLFKYRKFDIDEKLTEGKTDEEIIELIERIKKLRDPRIKFNKVQRLPWFFKHNYNDFFFFKSFISQITVLYSFFKTTMLAVILAVLYFFYTIIFFKIQFLKQMSVWFVIGMMYFWLMSGFNFFLKRYQFGKFTSQIQRFWKRTNTYFWLIEGFLMLLFFYYYLNSSQEPLYMYDYSALNQEYLTSLYTIGFNVILLSIIIYFMYFIMLRISSNHWSQINLYLIIVSVFIFFSFFIETYQFYYVISVFNERLWVFNEEENMWGVDIDNPILRTKHQYLLVCLIAKYWHFLFIFLSWIFFLIKSFEKKSVTYVLFGANLQNIIILYVLNFACYVQWFKWIYRRFFDLPYTWFFFNIDGKFLFKLFFELKLLGLNLIKLNGNIFNFYHLSYKSVNLWNVDSLAIWKFI